MSGATGFGMLIVIVIVTCVVASSLKVLDYVTCVCLLCMEVFMTPG